ncbi:hypothetical protein C8R45DRAFT_1093147 [Mycena sanguinolenta]|nr:hypothetical protein C8R45DRAFT_1093147 [Mycena sanguinolenta]
MNVNSNYMLTLYQTSPERTETGSPVFHPLIRVHAFVVLRWLEHIVLEPIFALLIRREVVPWERMASGTVHEAPAEVNGVNLLRNRKQDRFLGPYDGRVAAHVFVNNVHYFITTNANYIPGFAPILPNEICMRLDMRWGPDEPTLWPLEFSWHYPHFGAIPRRQLRSVMWGNPTRNDFVSPESGLTLTRGLGKLIPSKISILSPLVHDLLDACERYSNNPAAVPQSLPVLKQLMDGLRYELERLCSLPSTFERMVLGITNLQRSYLELAGFLNYMTIYKPRMEDTSLAGGAPDMDVLGVFTSNPVVAEAFHRARLPFWLMRPITSFADKNILRVLTPLDPAEWLELGLVQGFTPIPVDGSLESRIQGVRESTISLPWYKNPFHAADRGKPVEVHSMSGRGEGSAGGATSGGAVGRSRGKGKGDEQKNRRRPSSQPYPLKKPQSNAPPHRNKYEHFVSPFMASPLPAWASALAAVDRTKPSLRGTCPLNLYPLPEPALLVSASSEARVQLLLHHYQLMRDALLFRLGDCEDLQEPFTVQEWRDILSGKLVKQGKAGSLLEERTAGIEQALRPAMKACGITELVGFPVPPECVPQMSTTRAQEITWELAEINFRFELVSLDLLASGLDRFEACVKCFSSRMIIPRLDEGNRGFASGSPLDRLPHLLCLTCLMLDWTYSPRPTFIDIAASGKLDATQWDPLTVVKLEEDIAHYYTQTFYHYFGRAAVVPLCLADENIPT